MVRNGLRELVLANVSYLSSRKMKYVSSFYLLSSFWMLTKKARTWRHLKNVYGGCIINISVYRHCKCIMTEIPEPAHHLRPELSFSWYCGLWSPCLYSQWPWTYLTFASNIINVWPCFKVASFAAFEAAPSSMQPFGLLCPISGTVGLSIWWACL